MRKALPILAIVCGTIPVVLVKSLRELDSLTLFDPPT